MDHPPPQRDNTITSVKGEHPAPMVRSLYQELIVNNINQNGLLQPPAQATRQKRHRKKFDQDKRSETAATRKEGACRRCRKSGTRCHKKHREGLNPPPHTPSVNQSHLIQNNTFSSAAAPSPSQPNNYARDGPIDRFLGDPNNPQPLIGHFAPRLDLAVGHPLHSDGGGASVAGYGSHTLNSYISAQPRMQLPSNQKMANVQFNRTQSVPDSRSSLQVRAAALNSSYFGPANTGRVMENKPPIPHRRWQSQNTNLLPASKPISVMSLPQQFEGLTQTSGPTVGLNEWFPPPPRNSSYQLPNNIFGAAHAGSQFGTTGPVNSDPRSLAPYGKTWNPSWSSYLPPTYPGYGNTSSFQMDVRPQPQQFGGQPIMYHQGAGNVNNNVHTSLPPSYSQTFSHDNTFGIPSDTNNQTHSDIAPQSYPELKELLFDPVLDLELPSMLNGQPFTEPAPVNSGYYNTSAPSIAGTTQLPIRSAGENGGSMPIAEQQPGWLEYLYSDGF